jgi:hypothetical protein
VRSERERDGERERERGRKREGAGEYIVKNERKREEG